MIEWIDEALVRINSLRRKQSPDLTRRPSSFDTPSFKEILPRIEASTRRLLAAFELATTGNVPRIYTRTESPDVHPGARPGLHIAADHEIGTPHLEVSVVKAEGFPSRPKSPSTIDLGPYRSSQLEQVLDAAGVKYSYLHRKEEGYYPQSLCLLIESDRDVEKMDAISLRLELGVARFKEIVESAKGKIIPDVIRGFEPSEPSARQR